MEQYKELFMNNFIDNTDNNSTSSDCDKFIEGFRNLIHKIAPKTVVIEQGILTKLVFDDGTWIGIKKLFNEVEYY